MVRPLQWILVFAALSGVALIYGIWRSASFSEGEDGLVYLGRILTGDAFFHPHHLLFEPLYEWGLRISGGAFDLTALARLQNFTLGFALFGLLGVILLFRQVPVQGSLCFGFVAVSFGYWHYASAIDAYVPALAMAIWVLVVFDRRSAGGSWRWPVVAGGFAAVAVLFHQIYVIFAFGVFLGTLYDRDHHRWRLREALIFGFVSGGVVLGVYLLVFAFVFTSGPFPPFSFTVTGFQNWTLDYYVHNGLWDEPGKTTPILALAGFLRAIVTDIPFFGLPGLEERLQAVSGGRGVVEELFAAKTALGGFWATILALVAAFGLLALFVGFLAAVRQIWGQGANSLQRLLLIQFALFALFIGIWEAINKEFWIAPVVFLAVFAVSALVTTPGRLSLAVAVVLIGISNFFGAIRPYTNPQNDYWQVTLAPLLNQAMPGDQVIIACPWLCVAHIETLSGASVLTPDAALGAGGVLLSGMSAEAIGWAEALTGQSVPLQEGARHPVWRLAADGWVVVK